MTGTGVQMLRAGLLGVFFALMTVLPVQANDRVAEAEQLEADQIDGHLSYFDVDSATLRTPTISGLLFVAEYLEANPDQRILVEGHCDERGTRDYNLALGEKRAEAIRRQLVRQGIDRRRIKTKSFGKERPAMLGASPEAWAKNRRTVIRLISD